jgi:hypothetical protein
MNKKNINIFKHMFIVWIENHFETSYRGDKIQWIGRYTCKGIHGGKNKNPGR